MSESSAKTNSPQSEIFIFDDFHPEDNAMLQALYSRSPRSVMDHVDKVKNAGSGKFMESYYVGYGHASIGDCGTTTLFIENVSMLVAKAIQGQPLYSGQEASTRYLDFSEQKPFDPLGTKESQAIFAGWMTLYNDLLPKLAEGLKARYPFDEKQYKNEKTWEKAIQARAFDTARSLLPCGATTYVSWHTNLRQARDHLRTLAAHPLAEVRDVAARIFKGLYEKYPHSFNGEEMDMASDRYGARNEFAQKFASDHFYLDPQATFAKYNAADQKTIQSGGVVVDDRLMDLEGANRDLAEIMAARPKYALFPRRGGEYGAYRFGFLLDFGSYRDLQRHRNGYLREPIVGNQFGFHPWYHNEIKDLLSDEDFAKFDATMTSLFAAIESLSLPSAEELGAADKGDAAKRAAILRQYFYPMGMNCLVELTYSLPQTVYVAELRAAKTVHPSLRPIAQEMGDALLARHPGMKMYHDKDADSWTVKRGEQDIVKKTA